MEIYPPTIDAVTTPADAFWQLITGTKAPDLYVFIRNNGGSWESVTYPNGISDDNWQYNMPLIAGTNKIEVMASITSQVGATTDIVLANIYLAVLIPEIYNIWNCFDEFGLLLSLPRIKGETNRDYKIRLLDVYTNPSNSTYSGLRYGISREIGLSYSDVTIERLSDLCDSTYSGNLLNSDGNALGTPLEDYAKEVYDNNPIFFGNVISDESYWDGVDEEETAGYTFLPHIWDPIASGIYDKWQHGGIGDDRDFYIYDVNEEHHAFLSPSVSGNAWFARIHPGYFYSAFPSGTIGI